MSISNCVATINMEAETERILATTKLPIIATTSTPQFWLLGYLFSAGIFGYNVGKCVFKYTTDKFKKYCYKDYLIDGNIIFTFVGVAGLIFTFKKFNKCFE